MNIYVSQEDSLMREKFDAIVQEEKWDVDDDAKNKVLPSSAELTFYFKGLHRKLREETSFYSLQFLL